MPIYKQTTEITNIDDLLSSVERDIEEVYFGDKQVFTVWAEYDGTLPAQYSANGDYLADYRIYGAAGGVGDDSGTAYGYEVDMSVSDGTTSTTERIYVGASPLEAIGKFADHIDYGAQKIIRKIIKIEFTGVEYWNTYQGLYYHSVSNYINGIWGTTASFSRCSHFVPAMAPDEDGEYGLGGLTENIFSRWNGNILFKYGASLEDFKTYLATQKAAGTPVTVWYVCEIPIEENPPVPLPALPTVDGTNIVDYAGQSAAPSRFYAKYKKR